MLLCTSFDYGCNPPIPLVSCLFAEGKTEFFLGYVKGSGLKLQDVERSLNDLRTRIKGKSLYVLDSKAHFDAFNMEATEVMEMHPQIHFTASGNENEQKKALVKLLLRLKNHDDAPWRRVVGEACRVYSRMQTVPVELFGSRVRPIYHVDTVSGRSRATDFPIQSADESYDLSSERGSLFICLDWIAADLRMAAYMSEDKDLLQSFDDGDPYTHLASTLDVPRDEIKIAMLRAIYSMNSSEPVLDCYPILQKWIDEQRHMISKRGYSESILGRKFYLHEKRKIETVFNASIQGSVAHAMQATLIEMGKKLPNNLFTEIQDSLILTASRNAIKMVVDTASAVMLRPFDGILSSGPTLPLRVSIGTKWRRWKRFRELR